MKVQCIQPPRRGPHGLVAGATQTRRGRRPDHFRRVESGGEEKDEDKRDEPGQNKTPPLREGRRLGLRAATFLSFKTVRSGVCASLRRPSLG